MHGRRLTLKCGENTGASRTDAVRAAAALLHPSTTSDLIQEISWIVSCLASQSTADLPGPHPPTRSLNLPIIFTALHPLPSHSHCQNMVGPCNFYHGPRELSRFSAEHPLNPRHYSWRLLTCQHPHSSFPLGDKPLYEGFEAPTITLAWLPLIRQTRSNHLLDSCHIAQPHNSFGEGWTSSGSSPSSRMTKADCIAGTSKEDAFVRMASVGAYVSNIWTEE